MGPLRAQRRRGTGQAEHLIDWEPTTFPTSIARDGTIMVGVGGGETDWDLWTLKPSEEPQPYVQTRFAERAGRFSPDGDLVAYASDQSGRSEVYVQTFPPGGERQVVSTTGGEAPLWSPDGGRLYYGRGDEVFEVELRRSPSLRFGKPVKLFEGDYFTDTWTGFHVGKDSASGAERFLMVLPLPESIPERLRVVVGWGEKVGL